MNNQVAEEDTPRRSVRDMIGIWNERIAKESQNAQPKVIAPKAKKAKRPDTIIDAFERAPICAHCKQPNVAAALEMARPQQSGELVIGNLAQTGEGEARLRLSRIPQPRFWAKKGYRRGG